MMTTLLVARHGNTFEAGEPARRVGAHTDIPLTAKGEAQARALGSYLKNVGLIPDIIYSAPLRRARRTAELAREAFTPPPPLEALDFLTEIDYGPDEGKPEEEVVARIGREALDTWEKKALPPPGWIVEPQALAQSWIDFGARLAAQGTGRTSLCVTSNGIARFAAHLTGDFENFAATHGLKLATGAFGIFCYENRLWRVEGWNVRPEMAGF